MFIISILILLVLFSNYRKKQYIVYKFNIEQTLPLRGLLALFVISCHLAPHFKQSFVSADFGVMGAPSVSCFFFLSGYGLLVSLKQKGGLYFENFFKKRISKLFYPLIVVTVLFIVLQTFTEYLNIDYIFERLIHGSGTTPNSWFVFAIVLCYFTFYISFHKRNNLIISCYINTFIIIMFSLITMKLEWHAWTISLISFPLGIFISLYENKVDKIIKDHYLTLTLLFLITCSYCSYGLHAKPVPVWWPIFSNVFPLMIYMLFRGFSVRNHVVLNWIGKNSYEIYLIHGILIYFLEKYISSPYNLSALVILGSFLFAPLLIRLNNSFSKYIRF